MSDKCFYCNMNPEDLKGQKFVDGPTQRVFHMQCLQKEYMTNLENCDDESREIFVRFKDLIQRVDPNWRP